MAKLVTKVSELAAELGFNQKEMQAIDKQVSERSLSRMLTVLRSKEDLSQAQMATKLNVSQSFISKLENATNDQMNLSDIGKYLSNLGYEMTINISKPKPISQRIIQAYARLTSLFSEFQKCARDDNDILIGMAKFESEAARNVMILAQQLVESSTSKLKKITVTEKPRIVIDDIESMGEFNIRSKELSGCT